MKTIVWTLYPQLLHHFRDKKSPFSGDWEPLLVSFAFLLVKFALLLVSFGHILVISLFFGAIHKKETPLLARFPNICFFSAH
ncbi:hypothetical protein H7T43_03235 [Peribacillus simplex]|nr:hypothetical protein [Peribacillus simplex]